MKILIPVDGSANADRAVDYVIAQTANLKIVPEICLLNVQWKIASGNVKLFINQETINDYYREQGAAALTQSRAKLDISGLAYTYHVSVGSPAEAVLQYVKENNIDHIVMAAHGQTSLSTLLLGSVAAKIVQLAQIPVLLVK